MTRHPILRRLRPAAVLLLALLLPACQTDDGAPGFDASTASRSAPLLPAEDPRVQPFLPVFQRTEALLTRWDDLRAEGRLGEAEALQPKLRAEVDSQFETFRQAATGALGVYAQYLAASALGFSSRPEATTILQERLGERDARLQGNALIALGIKADPNTATDLLLERIDPAMPLTVKRYAPLALANVLEARTAAGYPVNPALDQQALARLGSVVVDADPPTRLHVVKALREIRIPGTFEYLQVLTGDPQMRVRWAAASALADVGDHRGIPDVIRLLGESAPESRHVVRDVLVTYAGNVQQRPLTEAEVRSLGTGPRAWSQWYVDFRRARGLMAPRAVPQPVGGVPASSGGLQPAPRLVPGAVRGG